MSPSMTSEVILKGVIVCDTFVTKIVIRGQICLNIIQFLQIFKHSSLAIHIYLPRFFIFKTGGHWPIDISIDYPLDYQCWM
jgi:hypothetical protein